MAQKSTSGGGYWKAPSSKISSPKGWQWAQKQYSPQFLKSVENTYGGWQGLVDQPGIDMTQLPRTAEEWRNYKPTSLADMYKGFTEKNPLMEQTQYNQAMERVRGAGGGAIQGLMNMAAARPGGASYGGFDNSVDQINKAMMEGGMDVATQQAMQNIAEQQANQEKLIGYTGQDIGNQMGWLQGLTGAQGTDWSNYLAGMGQNFNQQLGALQGQSGWLGQMTPYEQFNIQTPRQWAAQQAAANSAAAMNEERINAARRGETMGWLDKLMQWQNQGANQYYGGQQDWLNYGHQRGDAELGGYNPSWLGWTQE